mmetsp:Transcript_41378/g.74593  ORF Transcript_41378/g.74593 Transcript_41378/m.74593 type:complete len:99 (+) Transcript_41378:270-566(+)
MFETAQVLGTYFLLVFVVYALSYAFHPIQIEIVACVGVWGEGEATLMWLVRVMNSSTSMEPSRALGSASLEGGKSVSSLILIAAIERSLTQEDYSPLE